MKQTKYLSVDAIVKSGEYPFTRGQVRFFLTKRHKNGLGSAVRKVSKRIYIRKDLFDQWIESQSEKGGQS